MNVRTGGLLKIAGGLVVCVVAYLLLPPAPPGHHTNKAGIVLVIGPMIALLGMFELLSGVKSQEWAANWPSLPSWLKAIITVAAIAMLLVLVIGTIVLLR